VGIINKDKEFWRFLKEFDFISLYETWVEEKEWESLKKKIPDSHTWHCNFAKRDEKRGRAKGDFIVGKRKGWGEAEDKMGMSRGEEIVLSKVKGGKRGKSVAILSVYNTGKGIELEEVMGSIMKEKRENCVIIGGNFNIRIGENGGLKEIGGDLGRKSKNKVVRNGGRRLIDLVGELCGY